MTNKGMKDLKQAMQDGHDGARMEGEQEAKRAMKKEKDELLSKLKSEKGQVKILTLRLNRYPIFLTIALVVDSTWTSAY